MMSIAVAILIVSGVAFMIISPGFRKFIGVLAVVAAVALIAFVAWVKQDSEKHSREWAQQEAARARFAATAISASELDITDVVFRNPFSNDHVEMEGIITNRSKYKLEELTLELSAVDCPSYFEKLQYSQIASRSSECRIIGQQQVTPYMATPAGQTRAFRASVEFYGIPPKDAYYSRRFNFRIAAIKAAQ
jgi:hypothetical protein